MNNQQKPSGKKVFLALGLLALVIVGIIVCVLIWPKNATLIDNSARKQCMQVASLASDLEEVVKNTENTTQPSIEMPASDMILTVTTGVTRTRPEPMTKIFEDLQIGTVVFSKEMKDSVVGSGVTIRDNTINPDVGRGEVTYYKRIKVVEIKDDRIWLHIENDTPTRVLYLPPDDEVINMFPQEGYYLNEPQEKMIVIRCGTEQSFSFDFIAPDLTFTFKLEKKGTKSNDNLSETQESEPTTGLEPAGKKRLTVTKDWWSGWGVVGIGHNETNEDGENVFIMDEEFKPTPPDVTVFDDVQAGTVVHNSSFDGTITISKVEDDRIWLSFDNKSFKAKGLRYDEKTTEIVIECGEVRELYTPTMDAGLRIYFELERE